MTKALEDWVTKDQKTEVKPRFTFKRKFKNVDGQESFETTNIEAPNVDPTYYRWSQMQILNEIKEEMLYVAEEPVEGMGVVQQVRAQTVELPDGTQLQIAAPRAQLLEPLFNQVETLEGFTGVQNMIVESIGKTDIDIRRDMFQNIIITGGNTCYKGFLERLQRQIPEVAPQ